MSAKKISLLIVDDQQIVCDGIAALIEREKNMRVARVAYGGKAAVEMALELRPDVIVMDVQMPDMNGVEAARAIRKAWPEAKIVGLTLYQEQENVRQMLEAGALGFVLKKSASYELKEAVMAAYKGRKYLSSHVMDLLVKHAPPPANARNLAAIASLTAKQRDLLARLCGNHTLAEIAEARGVSYQAVHNQVAKLMRRFGVKTVRALARFYSENGLLGGLAGRET